MCMRSRNNIRSGLMDLRMDHEAGLVDRSLVSALGDISFAVDQDQIGGFHEREVLPEGVHPEVVFQDGVWRGVLVYFNRQFVYNMVQRTPHGNMTRNTLPVPLLPEESKRSSHVLLHPLALLVRVRECRDPAQLERPLAVTAGDGLEFRILLCWLVCRLFLLLDCDDGRGTLRLGDGFGHRCRHGGSCLCCLYWYN